MNIKRLATIATAKALQVRNQAGISLTQPISVFDLADKMGIELRLTDIPSMEGIYTNNNSVFTTS